MKLPAGKVRLMGSYGGHDCRALDDEDPAGQASTLYICNVAAALGNKACTIGNDSALPRERALALQREILNGLTNHQVLNHREHLLELQAMVLPKYGFTASPSGISAMLKAFDRFLGDAEIAELGDAINATLGMRPQVYMISEL